MSRLRCGAALLATALALPAGAQLTRLDDSGSPQAVVQVDLSRARQVDDRHARVPMGHVVYRLATAPYLGQRARIYYVVPLQVQGLLQSSGLRVEWRGSGRFTDGSAQPGERVPVWAGTMQNAWMEETLQLDFVLAAGSLTGGPLSLEPYFEIEVLP